MNTSGQPDSGKAERLADAASDPGTGSESDLPSISVVVPTYRRAAELSQCLEALVAQDYPASRMEIVIVDDGGGGLDKDRILAASCEHDIQLLTQSNQGPATARNSGAAAAGGRFLAFTDDDCQPRPGWLRALAAACCNQPLALVGGRIVNGLTDNLYSTASQDLVSYLFSHTQAADSDERRHLQPFFCSNNIACSRESFIDLNGFDESFPMAGGEDRAFSERWAAEIGPLVYLDGAVIDHYHHLSLARFARQHFNYGRGGAHLARVRPTTKSKKIEPLSFYWGMLAYPGSLHQMPRAALVSVLIALSQAFTLSGMVVEALFPSSEARSKGQSDS